MTSSGAALRHNRWTKRTRNKAVAHGYLEMAVYAVVALTIHQHPTAVLCRGMVFRRLKAAFGGGTTVDTVVQTPVTQPGGALEGVVEIVGGEFE